jgi:hypothetical protein
MQWYISQDGRTSGPFAEQRVAMLAAWGKLSRAAYICDEQSSCWVSITRSQFGPLLTERAHLETPGAAASSDDVARVGIGAGVAPSTWSSTQQRLGLAAFILLSSAALLLALRFSPPRANDSSPKGKAAAHALSSVP